MRPNTLYGTPLSLYTGKVRSYLIKRGLDYREITPTTTHYQEYVLPRARRRMMPTLETADGSVIRDGAAILEHFEAAAGFPTSPTGPRQRILDRLLDVIGMEGLLRPAMHYRWNFPDENEAFLQHHFASLSPAQGDREAIAARMMGRMREAAMAFGVVPAAIPGIESRYKRLLSLLDAHLMSVPYLLGGRPGIGDFSWIAPLYGHLGRDPKPLALMQSKALHVFRWVERMNRPEPDIGEFVSKGEPAATEFLADDAIPSTLADVLRQVALDFVPETLAAADTINRWLSSQSTLAAGTPLERGVGVATFEVDGTRIEALAQPYRFFLLARVHDAFDALSSEDRSAVEQMLDDMNLAPILGARLERGIGRLDNLEVWI